MSAKLNPHLAFGSAVHEALALVLGYCKDLDQLPGIENVNMYIRTAKAALIDTFTQSKGFQAEVILEEGFDGQMIQVAEDQTWLLDHYCDLLEGLVIGWCLVRLPLICYSSIGFWRLRTEEKDVPSTQQS